MYKTVLKKIPSLRGKWYRKGFHGFPHGIATAIEGVMVKQRKALGIGFTRHAFFCKNNYLEWFWNQADLARLRKFVISRTQKDAAFPEKLFSKWSKKLFKPFLSLCLELDGTDFRALSDKQLYALYEKFYDRLTDAWSTPFLIEGYSMGAEVWLGGFFKKFLEKKGKADKFGEYFALLAAPVEESFVNAEHTDLLEIMAGINNEPALRKLFAAGDKGAVLAALPKHPEINRRLERHAKNFFWVQNNYAKAPVLDEAFFASELIGLFKQGASPEKQLAEEKQRFENVRKEKARAAGEIGLDKKMAMLFHISELFATWHDERKKTVLISMHYIYRFLNEFSRRTGLAFDEVACTIPPETADFFMRRKFDRAELSKRRDGCLVASLPSGSIVVSGDSAQKLYDAFLKEKTGEATELRGATASIGKATGVVKVVQKTHDLAKFAQGDVLVASMTRPEYVVAMKKASAIVTDEGGVTCHAAVVSRELGIPCVIGTKVATKTLKDGDLVEVNATDGVVQILRK